MGDINIDELADQYYAKFDPEYQLGETCTICGDRDSVMRVVRIRGRQELICEHCWQEERKSALKALGHMLEKLNDYELEALKEEIESGDATSVFPED